MGDVVDVRPDRLLREMREHGNQNRACQASGMTETEFDDLCRSNLKFDRAQVECQLEYFEDHLTTWMRKYLRGVRAIAHKQLEARHG